MTAQDAHAAVVTDGRVHMRAMAQWWAAPMRRTIFARDMHARVRRQARPCQRLPWESRARVSSRPVRRQELDGCRARSTTAVKPRSRVDASRRTFCHHLHESVQCTHWPDAGPRRLNRAPSQADLALLRQVTPAGASLGETASAVPTAGWKYLASPPRGPTRSHESASPAARLPGHGPGFTAACGRLIASPTASRMTSAATT